MRRVGQELGPRRAEVGRGRDEGQALANDRLRLLHRVVVALAALLHVRDVADHDHARRERRVVSAVGLAVLVEPHHARLGLGARHRGRLPHDAGPVLQDGRPVLRVVRRRRARLGCVDRLVHEAEQVDESARVLVGLPDLQVAGFLDVAADVHRGHVQVRDVEVLQHRQHEAVRHRVGEAGRAPAPVPAAEHGAAHRSPLAAEGGGVDEHPLDDVLDDRHGLPEDRGASGVRVVEHGLRRVLDDPHAGERWLGAQALHRS
ncbi:hypothetical protein [Methylorubrum rhodesianum]|uniref:hypothetical protein n=1 Tax=Methylorubrum rhodesianum TaxID=29427 RepID=UPI001FF02F07|nr:hypothetical protein [Methylorubrum rhodesianum]